MSEPLNCDELLLFLNDQVDGDVDPGVCAELRRHLEGCDPCRLVVDNIRNTITIFKNGETVEFPIPFRRKLHDAIREKWSKLRSGTEDQ